MKLITVTLTFAAFVAQFGAAAASHHPSTNACSAAFHRCNFRFRGFVNTIPSFHIPAQADKAFTSRIVWKDYSKRIGIVNSNKEGMIVGPSGVHVPLSKLGFTPTQFNPYTIMKRVYGKPYEVATPFSGIGHEVFQGNAEAAKHKCVIVKITEYQTLTHSHPPTVSGNVNGANDCVVFRTL